MQMLLKQLSSNQYNMKYNISTSIDITIKKTMQYLLIHNLKT